MSILSRTIIGRALQSINALHDEIAALREQNAALREENAALQQESANTRIDELTGLYNRRWLRQFWNGLPTPGTAVSAVIMIDIDRFKLVNDRYGHKIGDRAIVHVAYALRRYCANAIRTGGDEFVLIVPRGQSPQEIAEAVLTEARRPMAVPGGPLTTTISIGVCQLDETYDQVDLSGVIERADLAMYAAKRQGNRVIVV